MSGPTAEVLASLRGKLEGFQEHLPLIKALRNPGLRDRHWDKISQSEPHSLPSTSVAYSSWQQHAGSKHFLTSLHDPSSGSQDWLLLFADT